MLWDCPFNLRTFKELAEQFFDTLDSTPEPTRRVHLRDTETGEIVLSGTQPQKGRLFVECDGNFGRDEMQFCEVSVIYYRTGYDPLDYDQDHERWFGMNVGNLGGEKILSISCSFIYVPSQTLEDTWGTRDVRRSQMS